MAPNDENATFLQRMKDSRPGQLWRLTCAPIKVRNGALTPRDVKNEGTSGDVYENKGTYDTMPDNTSGLRSDKYKSCAIIGAKSECF
jgi:hypothetical protein